MAPRVRGRQAHAVKPRARRRVDDKGKHSETTKNSALQGTAAPCQITMTSDPYRSREKKGPKSNHNTDSIYPQTPPTEPAHLLALPACYRLCEYPPPASLARIEAKGDFEKLKSEAKWARMEPRRTTGQFLAVPC